ncbi:39S ribosomal protein L53, mitochondrial [Scyliorhinus canicula]|uniref:39S ribosomal protein L53, mitochondrial n=1 Tax=Scyliorhinus canicula TaxID=7830 RepID=UPI0018F58368|nr:39S ribosomal protein L53, mitochondrial [Scyliorhinus canicula]
MAAGRGRVILKTVKEIIVQFCPFESNVRGAREFLAAIGTEKARLTNSNCRIVADVKHDETELVIAVTFNDGEKLVMKAANLTTREMLSFFTERCFAKDPQAQEMASKKSH